MLPGDGVLGVAAVGGHHLVEGGDAVAGLEFEDVGADLFDHAGDVVALVHDDGSHLGELPVLRVGPGDHDFDEDLVIVWRGDGRVDDLHLCSCAKSASEGYQERALGSIPLLTTASFIVTVVWLL